VHEYDYRAFDLLNKKMDIARLLDDLQPDWKEFIPGVLIFKEFNRLNGKPWVLEVLLNDASKLLGCFETEQQACGELDSIMRDNRMIVMSHKIELYSQRSLTQVA
jgi:hypothetical protein